MATPQSAQELTLTQFARSTLDLLQIWPALRLALSQHWGTDTALTHLAEDIVDLFYTLAISESAFKLPEEEDLEDLLLGVLSTEFNLTLEDGSERMIAKDLIALWEECLLVSTGPAAAGGRIETFRIQAEKARAEDGVRGFAAQRVGESDDEEGSGDDEDDDEDDEMDGGEPAGSRAKVEPIIDADGFEMVTKKGGRH